MARQASKGFRASAAQFRSNVSGVVQNRPEAFISTDEAVSIINMHSTQQGSWTANNIGYSALGPTFTNSIDGMAVYNDSAFNQNLVAASSGTVSKIDFNTGAHTAYDSATGFTSGMPVSFQQFQKSLYYCNGQAAAPRFYNGATAQVSAPWPITDNAGNSFSAPPCVAYHQNRLAYSVRNYVLLSDLNNAERFSTNPMAVGYTQASSNGYIGQVGDLSPIVGLGTLHTPATNKDILLIAKRNAIYALTGNSSVLTDSDPFTITKINDTYGVFNNNCMVQVGNDYILLNEYGLTSYTTSTTSGSLQPSSINSDAVIGELSNINLAYASKVAWGIHLPNRREVWFGIPTGSSTVVNEYLVYRYQNPADQKSSPKWSIRQDYQNAFQMSCGVLIDTNFYVGGYNGLIGWMFQSSTYNGIAFPWYYEHAFSDLGYPQQNKWITQGNSHWKLSQAYQVNIQTIWSQGGNNNTFTWIGLIGTAAAQGAFSGGVYDKSLYDQAVFAGAQESHTVFKGPGNGIRVKHILSGLTTVQGGPEYLGITDQIGIGNALQHWN